MPKSKDETKKATPADMASVSGNSDDDDLLFFESIRGNMGGVSPELKKNSYMRLISGYDDIPNKLAMREELCLKALLEYPDDLDFTYYLGETLNGRCLYHEAWEALKKCEALLKDKEALAASDVVASNPNLIVEQLAIAARGLDAEEYSAGAETSRPGEK